MASSNTVTVYGNVVEWAIEDGSTIEAATGDLYWWSQTGADTTPKLGATNTWWMVKTITFVPNTGASTGGEAVMLLEKDASGPILFAANIVDLNVVSQTYSPPLRCRPYWASTGGSAYTTGCKWIFHLA